VLRLLRERPMSRRTVKRTPIAGGAYWTSPGMEPAHLTPRGSMTVDEFIAWAKHNRELKAAGKPAPVGWQEWLAQWSAGRG
jgi:hypothetical protein